ncbi:hypothetical protein OXB_2851 [Bacillus sp. OxB-1]|uniref:hypothetical protein n=1 Tax=Bacillus sp. (strain OxB-1) TaxID=98228 RepID=UPI0005820F21|nr:hypothetical protein [Bacillus sp. OxB-1]BAQ11322.1 hypothetical protein OXB_2851 [Bacillus sp. OxB-1]
MRTLQDQLKEKGLLHPAGRAERELNTKTGGKQPERLTDRELRELMGVTRDVYRRGPGGAFRKR